MKIITPEERAAQQHATVVGGAKGFFGGLAVALPASYILQKRWHYYRSLPLSLKAFGVIIIAVPSFVISAEHAGLKFEKQHWNDIGKHEMDTIQAREQAHWDSLSIGGKIKDAAARHQYGFIGGAWALSMVGSFGIIMRDRYQTLPQKLVQARLWAQGLTLGVLIAAGIMTHARREKVFDEGAVRHLTVDHSWKDVVEEETREAHAAEGRTKVKV
ncbi:hypothetical protein C8Q75DRAFT_846226 [Abortiporus biennis]|nr:hypothetical protein C8Q75DRAFT_846226 [Abortiporus biennis]